MIVERGDDELEVVIGEPSEVPLHELGLHPINVTHRTHRTYVDGQVVIHHGHIEVIASSAILVRITLMEIGDVDRLLPTSFIKDAIQYKVVNCAKGKKCIRLAALAIGTRTYDHLGDR
ncbi:MAG: hypothetical protein IPO90_03450 [Flavobacteriales bacterium]|nr:hypothetical protein [Flavobacteriales bacterium]